jgi:hypothetical protein
MNFNDGEYNNETRHHDNRQDAGMYFLTLEAVIWNCNMGCRMMGAGTEHDDIAMGDSSYGS